VELTGGLALCRDGSERIGVEELEEAKSSWVESRGLPGPHQQRGTRGTHTAANPGYGRGTTFSSDPLGRNP
jgi:hypothetical protein